MSLQERLMEEYKDLPASVLAESLNRSDIQLTMRDFLIIKELTERAIKWDESQFLKE